MRRKIGGITGTTLDCRPRRAGSAVFEEFRKGIELAVKRRKGILTILSNSAKKNMRRAKETIGGNIDDDLGTN